MILINSEDYFLPSSALQYGIAHMFQKLEMGNISVNKYKTIVMFSVYFTENVETVRSRSIL